MDALKLISIDEARIRVDAHTWERVKVKSWRSHSGMVVVVAEDGCVYVAHPTNVVLVKSKKDEE